LKDSTSTRDNTPKETTSYTLQEVTTHKDETSCWAIINNKVYDLTDWINNHPGGPDKIVNICGTDGSQAFNMEHGGQPQPQTMLQQFYKGELKNN
jgi:cytochrome b involved in lipid metabolism